MDRALNYSDSVDEGDETGIALRLVSENGNRPSGPIQVRSIERRS